MSRMAFSHEWTRKRLYDSFYKLFYEMAFSLHTDSWDDHFWHVLFIKKMMFFGESQYWSFYKKWSSWTVFFMECISWVIRRYKQFPLKKSSNPCAMFAFECYFARILIHFLIYCSSSLTTRPSLSFDGRRRGMGRGRRRGGEEGGTWSHGAHTAPASMPMNLREKGRETNVRYVSGLDLDQKTHFWRLLQKDFYLGKKPSRF